MIPPYYTQRQIARIEATSVSTVGTNVVYNFRSHPYFNALYNGLVIVKLMDVPTGSTTQPIVFSSGNGNDVTLVGYGGATITATEITGSGIYICYYDSTSNTLQLIN